MVLSSSVRHVVYRLLHLAKRFGPKRAFFRTTTGWVTRIGVTRPVVSVAFLVYFWSSLCGRPPYFNYDLVALPACTRMLLQQAVFEILTNGIPEYTQAKRLYLKGMTKIGR